MPQLNCNSLGKYQPLQCTNDYVCRCVSMNGVTIPGQDQLTLSQALDSCCKSVCTLYTVCYGMVKWERESLMTILHVEGAIWTANTADPDAGQWGRRRGWETQNIKEKIGGKFYFAFNLIAMQFKYLFRLYKIEIKIPVKFSVRKHPSRIEGNRSWV